MLNKSFIFKSAAIITLATLLSKVFGLVRQQYSLYLFGGGWEFDSFIAAFRIPNALRELLAEGALSAAFIPLFSALLVKKGKKEAFTFASQILTLALLLTMGIALLSLVVSDHFMSLYHHNPNFPQATSLAVELFNILMFYLPFISLSALLMGMLNSMDKFTIPALGPFFSNVSFLTVLYFTYKPLGIHSLSYAFIAGGLTYFIIQVPSIVKSGFRFKFSFNFKDENIKEFFMLFFPFALAMGVPKLNNILSNIFSDEITGANTALSQGFFIIQLPLSIFVAGISMVSLPNLSKYFEAKDMSNFKELILVGLRMVLIVTLPSMLGLMLLDYEISRFIYSDVLLLFSGGDRGKINDEVIRNIALAQYYFAPGIISMGISIILIRAFQSMKDMKTMIYTGSISVALHLVLMFLFLRYFGWSFDGIAISITLSSFFNLLLLIIILLNRIGRLPFKNSLISIVKMLTSLFLMGLFIFIVKDSLYDFKLTNLSYINNMTNTLIIITLAMFVYFLSLYFLKEKELNLVIDRILNKFLPKRK